VTYYDANNVAFGGAFHPVTLPNHGSSPAFFGFESDLDPIKYVRIKPSSGPFITTLDNFTTELSPAVPEPSTWTMLLIGFFGLGAASYRHRRDRTA
jgi:hypothetical protein